jgi:hypothetical protein
MRRRGLGSIVCAGVVMAAAAACGLDTSGTGLFADDGGSSGSGGASGSGSGSGGSSSGSSSGAASGSSSGSSSGGSSGSGSGSGGSSGSGSGGSSDGGNTGPCVSGWTLVLGVSGGGGCPGGYPEVYMGVTNPQAQTGACTCSCNVTQQPSCTTGNVNWSYGMLAPLCFGSSPVNSNGMCQPYNGSLQAAQSVQPLPSTGGACTAQAMGNTGKVQTTQVRTCSVPASDEAAVCGGGVPVGSAACIIAPGNVPCPQGAFQVRSVIADTETLVCSACGACSVTASCTNAELDIYSDMQCMNMTTSIPANGMCVGVQAGQMQAYWYKAQVSAPTCKATTTASFQATNAQTLCCR